MKSVEVAITVALLLGSCEKVSQGPRKVEPEPVLPEGVELPAVTSNLDPAGRALPDVTIRQAGIEVGGHTTVALTDGQIDPADLEGGPHGLLVPKLRAAAGNMPASGVLVLAVDGRVSYRVLIHTLFSMKPKKVELLARNGSRIVVAPITIPDMAASAGDNNVRVLGPGAPPPSGPVQLIVARSERQIMLASLSGLEGTFRSPRLEAGRDEHAKLTAALSEIVERRWKSTPRDAIDESVIVMLSADASVQDTVSLIGAVLRATDGSRLFTSVLLSAGVE